MLIHTQSRTIDLDSTLAAGNENPHTHHETTFRSDRTEHKNVKWKCHPIEHDIPMSDSCMAQIRHGNIRDADFVYVS